MVRPANAPELTLTSARRAAIVAFLTAHPNGADEPSAAAARADSRRGPRRPQVVAAGLQAELRRLSATPEYGRMLAARRELPAYQHRRELLDTIFAHSVTLVRGATGCGKSTQLPALLLEAAAAAGEACGVMIAQPRRIAAVALAERVASELGDTRGPGGLVGYSIRGESRVGAATAATFVTKGVLLRALEGGGAEGGLSGVTHLLLDEVHERSVDLDLILLAMKRLIAGGAHRLPKLVLLSATVDTKAFERYFGEIGVVEVPGRAFPVAEFFLEDAVAAAAVAASDVTAPAFTCPLRSPFARASPLPDAPTLSPTDARAVAVAEAEAEAEVAEAAAAAAGGGGSGLRASNLRERAARLATDAAASASGAMGEAGTSWLCRLGAAGTEAALGGDATAAALLRRMDLGVVNEELVVALVLRHHLGLLPCMREVSVASRPGAVLVFVPGVGEVHSLVDALAAASPEGLLALPLHGGCTPAEQRAAFAPAPRGRTKVVIATDVAEASITIEDVTLVCSAQPHSQSRMSSQPREPTTREGPEQKEKKAVKAKLSALSSLHPCETDAALLALLAHRRPAPRDRLRMHRLKERPQPRPHADLTRLRRAGLAAGAAAPHTTFSTRTAPRYYVFAHTQPHSRALRLRVKIGD